MHNANFGVFYFSIYTVMPIPQSSLFCRYNWKRLKHMCWIHFTRMKWSWLMARRHASRSISESLKTTSWRWRHISLARTKKCISRPSRITSEALTTLSISWRRSFCSASSLDTRLIYWFIPWNPGKRACEHRSAIIPASAVMIILFAVNKNVSNYRSKVCHGLYMQSEQCFCLETCLGNLANCQV